MDIASTALLALGIIAAAIILLRTLNVWERSSTAAVAKAAQDSARMTELARKRWEKERRASKKSSRDRDDEEDLEEAEVGVEGDDLDRLLDRFESYKPAIAGFIQRKNIPLNVERLFNRDPSEMDKAAILLEAAIKQGVDRTNLGGSGQQPPTAPPYI